jgi:hypothetical protein
VVVILHVMVENGMIDMICLDQMLQSPWPLLRSRFNIVNLNGANVDGQSSIVPLGCEVLVDTIDYGNPSYHRGRHGDGRYLCLEMDVVKSSGDWNI